MARPNKEGLEYFSFDVDFFDNKKVRKIMRGCGPVSALILTSLLCNIYQNKGYYILVDDDLPFDIADKLGVSEGAVKETISKAVQVNFFNQHQFETNQILTSPEILSRYKSATSKREKVLINKSFIVYSTGNRVNDGINSINDTRSTQSKVKESKGDLVVERTQEILQTGNENNNSPPVPHGPPNGLMDIDLLKEKVFMDAEFISQFMKEEYLNLSKEAVYGWLVAFNRRIKHDGESKKLERDYRRYFSNWLPMQELKTDPAEYSPLSMKQNNFYGRNKVNSGNHARRTESFGDGTGGL